MSVLRGRGASESFKEMREGLRRELQLVGDGLKREGRGKKEHLPDVGKEGGLDEVFGCLLCHAMGHLCQIAGAYPQLVGIVVDIVAVAALFFLQGEELAIEPHRCTRQWARGSMGRHQQAGTTHRIVKSVSLVEEYGNGRAKFVATAMGAIGLNHVRGGEIVGIVFAYHQKRA